MVSKVYTFQGCACAIEDIHHPETGELEGRAFIIIDNDSQDVYRYPMPLDVAKIQGQRLMGIGGVEIVTNGSAAMHAANGHGKR